MYLFYPKLSTFWFSDELVDDVLHLFLSGCGQQRRDCFGFDMFLSKLNSNS